MSGEVYWPQHIARGELIANDGTGAAARVAKGPDGHVLMIIGGMPIWVPQTSLDHGSLAGILDDDHPQYALLAGRAGGQALKGSPVAAEGLVLQGSGVAGTGYVIAGINGSGNAILTVDEPTDRVFARGWMRVGSTAPPTQALAVTGDIGGSNEIQAPKGRISNDAIVGPGVPLNTVAGDLTSSRIFVKGSMRVGSEVVPGRTLDVTGDIGGSNELQVPRGRISDNLTVVNSTTLGAAAPINLNPLDVNGVANAVGGFKHNNAAAAGAILQGDGTSFKADPPGWTTVAFAAGDFTTNSAATWTVAAGDVNYFRYKIIGKTMFVSIVVSTSSVSAATPSQLQVLVPGGRSITGGHYGTFYAIDNLVRSFGWWFADAAASATKISFLLASGGVWAASADATYIFASVQFQIA